MSIKSDYHMHSSFSCDSDEPMENMVKKGINLGFTHICFTEHMDFDFPYNEEYSDILFEVNTDAYLYDLLKIRAKYEKEINVLFGIELGLQPHLSKENAKYIKEYDFDFVIASSHLAFGRDPYYEEFYDGRSEDEAHRAYFESILENIRQFSNFDVYGHLDYVVRYGANKNKNYSYHKHADVIDEILSLLIRKDKGIEINSRGLTIGLLEPNPCRDIIRRYRELGGEIITIGSDAHSSDMIGADFDKVSEILIECGFKEYTVFEKRIPVGKGIS